MRGIATLLGNHGGRVGSPKWLPVAGPVKLSNVKKIVKNMKKGPGTISTSKTETQGCEGKNPYKIDRKTPAGTCQRAVLLLQENLCQAPMAEEKKLESRDAACQRALG